MTRTKKWGIGAGVLVAVLAIAGLAFALTRNDSNDESPEPQPVDAVSQTTTTPEPPPEEEELEQLPCTKRAAEKALDRGALGRRVSETMTAEGSLSEGYELELIGCADLTGDGLEEMVLKTKWGVSTNRSPWAVLSQQEGEWQAEFVREQVVVSKLKLHRDEVREVSLAWTADDPTAAPSGKRVGIVRYEDGEWLYKPKGLEAELEVGFDGAAPATIAGEQLAELTPGASVDLFGQPSFVFGEGETCSHSWQDIGLTIYFAHLGIEDACGEAARIGSLVIAGAEAAQASWLLDGQLRVGARLAELKKLYPQAKRSPYGGYTPAEQVFGGKPWALLEQESPYGEGGLSPTLQANVAGGEAVSYHVAVGAAGE